MLIRQVVTMSNGGEGNGQTPRCAVCGTLGNGRFCSRCGAVLPAGADLGAGDPTAPKGIPGAEATPYPPAGGTGQSDGPGPTQSGPPIMQSTGKKRRPVGLILAIIAGVIVITAAAVGTTVLVTHKGPNTSSTPAAKGVS